MSTFMYFDIRDQDLEGRQQIAYLTSGSTCHSGMQQVFKCMVYHHITPPRLRAAKLQEVLG